MPKYVIERNIPGAGNLKPEELQAIAQKSCGVLRNMGPQVQWVQSYVTADKIYCIYIAPDEQSIRDHAQQGEFPANSISEITTIIDPTTAEVRTSYWCVGARTGVLNTRLRHGPLHLSVHWMANNK